MYSTKTLCILCLCIAGFSQAISQSFTESFSDGDFTANPAWVGNTADFIVNSNQQLQSNNTIASSSFYLSTASTLATTAQWEFYTQLAFSTSGANYVDVYLVSAQSDLLQVSNSGYFVRIGNTDDEVSLYRKDANQASVKIIDGIDGGVGASNNTVKIKVIRNASNQWILYHDASGTGNTYVSDGTATDATYNTSAFFGILVKQSTASFFQKHFFDDIAVTNYTPDVTPPALTSATALTANTLSVVFSEPVDAATASDINNYSVNTLGKPTSAVVSASSPNTVTLTFSGSFNSGTNYTLTATGIKDLAGNTLSTGSSSFSYFVVGRYSIVIDEIMADPTPQVGLPNAEWIEIKNTTPVPINIKDYRLGKTGSISGPLPSYTLQPDSFLIITTSSQVSALSAFGGTISVTSFPSLGNDGDLIFLQTAAGDIMHVVNYSSAWYQNTVKADGGWTLEMIDTHNPCAGAGNWRASTNNAGGTPGKKNSIDAVNADQQAPKLLRASAMDNVNLVLFFDEPLDSVKAAAASYTISDGIGAPKTIVPVGPIFDRVNLVMNNPLNAGKIYTVNVSGVTDCSGNAVSANSTAPLGLSSSADSLDIVINEILFDPKDFGVDYLELYNRSNKIIDLSTISIANRSSTTNAIGTPVSVTKDNYLLFPGEYVLLTSDPSIVKQQYTILNPDNFITVSLPSFPDTKGSVIILNTQGSIVDEVDYSDKWHFALLDNEQGVALERIAFDRGSNDASNWTSAAGSAGFGTPGYQNSQFRGDQLPQGNISVTPKMFSPDNDGFEDFAFINFQFSEPGYVVNISIYDAAGRPVRVLQRNTTVAATGVFRWDGLNDKLQKVPVGTYVIYTDIFNLKGQKKQFKNAVSVARKF